MARTVVLRFLGDTTSLDAAFRKLRAESIAASSSVSARWKATGESVTKVGTSITKNLSAPAALAGGYAAKLALDFDASMLKIRALVGASAEQVADWREGVLEMSRALPQSADELAQSLYFITSSGVDASQAMSVLEATARASAAGLGETQQLADLATSAMNAYGPSNLSAAQTMDVLIAAIREGKAEPEEFAASLGRVISPAQNLGVSFDQVTGSMAAMSLVGISADEASTALRATMMSMLKPSAMQVAAAKELGLSYDEIRQSVREKGLLATLTDLKERVGDDEEAIARLFPNVRALNGVLAITGENAGNTARIMGATASATGSVDEAFKITAEGAKFRLNAALSSMQATMIEIGAVIVPMMVAKMERLGAIFDWLGNQPPWAINLAGHLLVLTAAVGPLIIFIGKLITGIGAIIGAVGPTIAALGKFWAMLGRVWAVMKTVLFWAKIVSMFFAASFGAPILIAIGVIAALVAAFVLAWKHSETFRNIVRAAMQKVGEVMKTAGEWFVKVGKIIWKAITEAGEVVRDVALAIIKIMIKVWTSIRPVLQKIWDFFKTVFDAIAKVVKVALKVIFYAIAVPLAALGILIVKTLNMIMAIWAKIFGALATVAVTIWNKIRQVVSSGINKTKAVITTVLAAVKAVWSATWNTIKSVTSSIWSGLRSVISSGVNAVRSAVSSGLNAVRSVFSKIWNSLPSPVRSAMGSIKSLVSSGISAVFGTVRSLGSRITGIAGSLFNGLKTGFRNAVNWIIGRWNGLRLTIPSVKVMGKTVFGGASIGTPNIPMLANGAVVDKPTLAMIGEAGREVVLPLTRPARAMELLEESGMLSRLRPSSGAGDSTPGTTAPVARQITVQRGAVQVSIEGVTQDVAAEARGAVSDAFAELLEELRSA